MSGGAPPIDELSREAERLGVTPTDDDLARVRAFLDVLLPALDKLEQLVPDAMPPGGIFRPEVEP